MPNKLTPAITTYAQRHARTVDGRVVHEIDETATGWTGSIYEGDNRYRSCTWDAKGKADSGLPFDELEMQSPLPPEPALVQDFAGVVGHAESFVLHWETDEGQTLEEQRDADNARIALDRTAPMIIDLAALVAGGPDARPLVDVLGDAESALSQCFEQLEQLRAYTRPTFDNDEDVENALRDAEDAEGALRLLQDRIAALGSIQPIMVPCAVVNITGGVIQGISADGPVDIYSVDYDTDGIEPEHLSMIGEEGEANVTGHDVEIDPAFVEHVLGAPSKATIDAAVAGRCSKCGTDLDNPSAAGAEDGVCGPCIQGEKE